MPRGRRIKSQSGYYHVMLRGNEKKNIFNDEGDKKRFIKILGEKKENGEFYLPAFCLMSNHVHLMIKEGSEDLSNSIKRIGVSYVSYFNNKYDRVGHLFYDRFRSEPVENESYVIALVRYIHKNPVKAGIVKSAIEYRWSSYNCYLNYLNQKDKECKIVDADLILDMLSENKVKAVKILKDFMDKSDEKDIFIDIDEKIDMDMAKELFYNMGYSMGIVNIEDPTIRRSREWSNLIKKFKKETGLSIRDIAFITGISSYAVRKMLINDL